MRPATREPAGDKGTADRIEADDGGYWVRLVTWQALDREGACMQHCVGDGDYDRLVGGEDLQDNAIWSLRNKGGLSILTVRIRNCELNYAKGYTNHPPGRGASLQVRHLVAAFKAAGHELKVSTSATNIVLLEDGRTFRADRLPREVVAARAEASRRRQENERALATMRADARGQRWCSPLRGQVVLRRADGQSVFMLNDVEVVGGGSSGYEPGGGVAVEFQARFERVEIRSNENPRRPIQSIEPGVLPSSYARWDPAGSSIGMRPSPPHEAFQLTQLEADPIVEMWSNPAQQRYRTRSGVTFEIRSAEYMHLRPLGQGLRAAAHRLFMDRYRAAVGHPPAPEPSPPSSEFQEAWGKGGRVIEQARVAQGPGQPATAEPPS